MNISKNLILSNNSIAVFCDRGIICSLCALIFFLPVSIALLDSFAALAVLFYFLKKINQIVFDWPLKTSDLNFLDKIYFILKGFAPQANILDRPIQFLVLVVFISVLQSQYPVLSLLAFFGKFLKGVFLYFSFIEAFTTDRRIRIFLNIFLASAFVVALNGVIEHYRGVDFLKGHITGSGRVNSSFSDCNGLGAYLIPVIGLVVQFLFSAIGKDKSWLMQGTWVILLILLMSCLCWTYSRSSWVGFLSVLVLMVWINKRKALYAGVLLLIFIFIFLPSLNHVRHVSLINDSNPVPGEHIQTGDSFSLTMSSLLEQGGSGRRGFWKKAVSIIRTSPILGTGLNTYTRVLKRDPHASLWYAHNCYLQLAAETGLLGLACFLWVLFVLFQQGLIGCRAIEGLWPKIILQGTLAGLFGFLIQSFFDNTFYTVQLGVLLWMLIGLAVAVMRRKTNE